MIAVTAEKAKVLVIDDELGPRESIRFLFKGDYDVLCADSVDAGLVALRDEHPDVVILDIKMPGKTGIEGLSEIRAVDDEIAVIMLTGFGNLETAQKAIRLGANDYIKKPFDTREMRDAVSRYIEHTRVARTRARTTHDLKSLNNQLSDELQDKEHLASLGEASSELVHDLRNPLTVISGYVQLLLQEIDEGEGSSPNAMDYLEMINKNVSRCQEMAEVWRSMGRKDALDLKPMTVDEFIAEAFEAVSSLAQSEFVQMQMRPGPCGVRVNIDRLQMIRVLENLVSNAVDALPKDGGLVVVGWTADDEVISITVEDNGTGIPEKLLERVFDAYVTTKKRSGGMGIGLCITKRAVELHSGTLTLANKAEGGVAATVQLPCAR